MPTREELEKKVEELERDVATLKQGSYRGVRKRADWGIGDLPFWEVALGPDLAKGEMRGHAKAIVAVGDIATGVLALGGWARGVVAFGGMATGLVSFGGLSVGVLLAIGGLAIGGAALGGGAVGGVAIGGGAFGYYACGGGTAGQYISGPQRRDPEADAFFRRFGLQGLCNMK